MVKPREPRRKVFIPARMRFERRWGDVRVLDVSSRGFLLQSSQPLERGAYVELCRGRQSFVARVVWTREQRFGVRTQDPVAIDAFIHSSQSAGHDEPPGRAAVYQQERRLAARQAENHAQRFERSRYVAKAMEYGSVVGFGGIAAVLILGMIQQAMAHPLSMVSSALGGH